MITLNLDLRQFAKDVIESGEEPELLRAFWRAIEQVTVLDPTCGSGAFLFAALNILEPLYEACLQRMTAFPDDGEFREVRQRMARHPNRRYFILKSIILNNLFGVDIMEEATEICKLRLFLKLAAQVEPDAEQPNLGIEPLPDIDFNIRAGNTLVGFATEQDFGRSGNLASDQSLQDQIKVRIADLSKQFEEFRRKQVTAGQPVTVAEKQDLQRQLKALDEELNRYLAVEYGKDPKNPADYAAWVKSHQPFHWFVEFYGIMNNGGFDVIIGNPPYVELKALNEYEIHSYICSKSGNLYAIIIERCLTLIQQNGRQGYIVPVSSISTERYMTLQKFLIAREDFFASFDDRPSRLFDGIEHIRLAIHLIGRATDKPHLFSTRYNKWMTDERSTLFNKLNFATTFSILVEGTLPKLCSNMEQAIINKLIAQKFKLSNFYRKTGKNRIFYSRKIGYFLQVLDFEPIVLDGKGYLRPPSEFKELRFDNEDYSKIVLCCLNSNLFYWFVTVFSDCRHVNKREVDSFPINLINFSESIAKNKIIELARILMESLKFNSENRIMSFKHDTLTVQCIYPKNSKLIIDQIDSLLAKHYGFTDEELDFIINYDIKYRMGRDNSEE